MTDGNRVVVVTGAGGAGCGRSISARFATRGAAVVVSDIDEESGTILSEQSSGVEAVQHSFARMCVTSHRSGI
jgi:NAD(P)-dependent dehydrogenase (short-subunit alcohol dehydrogenase family)